MIRVLSLVAGCLLSAALLYADDPVSYEADPDLIQTQGYVVYFNVQGPMSYATATHLPDGAVGLGPVYSQVCQHALSIPFTANLSSASGRIDGALGDGGFIKALKSLQKKTPDLAGIYNVQVDTHQTQILSIYTRLCTEITGLGYKRTTS